MRATVTSVIVTNSDNPRVTIAEVLDVPRVVGHFLSGRGSIRRTKQKDKLVTDELAGIHGATIGLCQLDVGNSVSCVCYCHRVGPIFRTQKTIRVWP